MLIVVKVQTVLAHIFLHQEDTSPPCGAGDVLIHAHPGWKTRYYIPFTEEQKQRANSVDLVDFLQRQDSVTTRGNEWFRHKSRQGGHTIDFAMEFYHKNFPEAVQWLLGGETGVEWNQFKKSAPPPKKEIVLPEANPDMRRVFAYLVKQRFIDQSVLSYFARARLIFEDKEYTTQFSWA